MLPTRKYPAKVILFGEYTVLIGGDILAVPYPEFASHWELKSAADQRLVDFVNALIELDIEELDYKLLLQLGEFVSHGWQLTSNITIGAGLGSSGSVVAAIYDFVGNKVLSLDRLRNVFQQMEGYFHGQSSGIDPLVSYLQSGVVIQSGTLAKVESLSIPEFKLFNSKIERNTESLVAWFRDSLETNQAFAESIQTLKELNNSIIRALLAQQEIGTGLVSISKLQLSVLAKLIPDEVAGQWNIDSTLIWKICGAGGGGYFLQFKQV